MRKFLGLFLIVLTLLAGCGSGSNNNRAPGTDTNADLSDLILSAGSLDQIFQANQTGYTATVGFLAASTTVTPTTDAANATITVNGTAVTSGTASGLIALNEGLNTINVIVTSGDGAHTTTYTVTVTRQTSADFARQAFLKASNSESDDWFGVSVALEGDTLVVGAFAEDSSAGGGEGDNSAISAGAVYVFTRINGVWTQQAYLKASNAEAGDQFGISVALSGDTLVVGAAREDSSANGGEGDNSAISAGAAYVFTRINGVWTQQAYIKASNAEMDDQFGISVALSGDTLAVGAIFEDSSANGGEADNSADRAGAVYVFTRNNAAWTQQAYLKASNAESVDLFGRGETQGGGISLALSGDTLAVGAIGEDSSADGGEADNSVDGAGAVYVFTRNNGVWTQQAFLKASNAGQSDNFGLSVALSGDDLVVGAVGESSCTGCGEADNSVDVAGAAYVFTRSNGVWTQQAFLKASNADLDDTFGAVVALSGDTLAVGAIDEDSSAGGGEADNSVNGAGAVYVFTRNKGVWTQQAFLKASNAGINDSFGASVALWGDTVAVGAALEDSSVIGGEADNSTTNAGAVYIFK